MTSRRTSHRTSKTPARTGGDDRPAPACGPDTAHLFGSLDVADHMKARTICADCPMVKECISEAVTIAAERDLVNQRYRGPDGTWGGLLWKAGVVLDLDDMPRIHKRKDTAA